MRIALAQINTTVGDFASNGAKLRAAIARARQERADVVVFPELVLCGYPPMDLLERASFVEDHARALEALASEARGLAVVAGAIVPAQEGCSRPLANAAVVLVDGRIVHVQPKTLLPTYDVFDVVARKRIRLSHPQNMSLWRVVVKKLFWIQGFITKCRVQTRS